MSNPAYWGESFTDEMKSKGLMLSLEGVGQGLGLTGRTIFTPEDFAVLSMGDLLNRPQLERMAGLGQGYNYYGSSYPGGQPQQTSDWDKFMQFNSVMAPLIGNILGTWIQGRAQVQSSKQMADAFDRMSPEQQEQVMEAYLVEKTLRDQGISTKTDDATFNNMGGMFGQANPSAVNNAYTGAFSNLQNAAGGNAQLLAAFNRSGASVKASSGFSIPSWVLIAGVAAVGYYLYTKKGGSLFGPKGYQRK